MTGTVVQGCVKVNDTVELSSVNDKKVVKSIQMFKKSIKQGKQGDRIGMLIKNLNAEILERGIAFSPGYLQTIDKCIINLQKIKFFK